MSFLESYMFRKRFRTNMLFLTLIFMCCFGHILSFIYYCVMKIYSQTI